MEGQAEACATNREPEEDPAMTPRRTSRFRLAMQACTLSLAAAAGLVAVTGCANEQAHGIPARAMLGSEGNGDMVSYTTATGGTAYVYDASDNKLVWSGTVLANQMVAVDAKADAITLDGRKVREKGIHGGHRYRIFIEPVIHG
jgi:hypothetical protein